MRLLVQRFLLNLWGLWDQQQYYLHQLGLSVQQQ
jgi:hypothetical protein